MTIKSKNIEVKKEVKKEVKMTFIEQAIYDSFINSNQIKEAKEFKERINLIG